MNSVINFTQFQSLYMSDSTVIVLQYCAKVKRANFDKFRLLFSRIFDDMLAKFLALFRITQLCLVVSFSQLFHLILAS